MVISTVYERLIDAVYRQHITREKYGSMLKSGHTPDSKITVEIEEDYV